MRSSRSDDGTATESRAPRAGSRCRLGIGTGVVVVLVAATATSSFLHRDRSPQRTHAACCDVVTVVRTTGTDAAAPPGLGIVRRSPVVVVRQGSSGHGRDAGPDTGGGSAVRRGVLTVTSTGTSSDASTHTSSGTSYCVPRVAGSPACRG